MRDCLNSNPFWSTTILVHPFIYFFDSILTLILHRVTSLKSILAFFLISWLISLNHLSNFLNISLILYLSNLSFLSMVQLTSYSSLLHHYRYRSIFHIFTIFFNIAKFFLYTNAGLICCTLKTYVRPIRVNIHTDCNKFNFLTTITYFLSKSVLQIEHRV